MKLNFTWLCFFQKTYLAGGVKDGCEPKLSTPILYGPLESMVPWVLSYHQLPYVFFNPAMGVTQQRIMVKAKPGIYDEAKVFKGSPNRHHERKALPRSFHSTKRIGSIPILVGGLEHDFYFSIHLGMPSTNSYISEGVKPPARIDHQTQLLVLKVNCLPCTHAHAQSMVHILWAGIAAKSCYVLTPCHYHRCD